MSSVLTLDKLKAVGVPVLLAEPVPVYEFGAGTVAYIATLDADERDARLEAPWLEHKKRTGQKDDAGFRSFVAAACWCNSQARDFVASDAKEIAEVAAVLGKHDSKPVDRMFQKACELNGLTEAQVDAIAKN